jgi:hypothetical protein
MVERSRFQRFADRLLPGLVARKAQASGRLVLETTVASRASLLAFPPNAPPPIMEVQGGYWRTRAGIRGHVCPANQAFAVCRECLPVTARALADVPVAYAWPVVCSQNRGRLLLAAQVEVAFARAVSR